MSHFSAFRQVVQEWPNFPNFMRLKRFVSGFKVTNTCAEHAVQLATMYNNRVVKTDVQRSYLYATVEQQRRDRSDLFFNLQTQL